MYNYADVRNGNPMSLTSGYYLKIANKFFLVCFSSAPLNSSCSPDATHMLASAKFYAFYMNLTLLKIRIGSVSSGECSGYSSLNKACLSLAIE